MADLDREGPGHVRERGYLNAAKGQSGVHELPPACVVRPILRQDTLPVNWPRAGEFRRRERSWMRALSSAEALQVASDVIDQDAAFNQLLCSNRGAAGEGQGGGAVQLLVAQRADVGAGRGSAVAQLS